jgi:hypothetical protein
MAVATQQLRENPLVVMATESQAAETTAEILISALVVIATLVFSNPSSLFSPPISLPPVFGPFPSLSSLSPPPRAIMYDL